MANDNKQGGKSNTGMKADMIRFDEIYYDYDRNVRMTSRYATDPIPNFDPSKHRAGLYESIEQEGLKIPLTVALLSIEDRARLKEKTGVAYKYRGIAGHRRAKVISKIRVKTPDRFIEVPAVVYSGLTENDEIRMMMDHEHVEQLNDFERYLSIKRLLLTGLSEEAVGVQMGVSRGYVQRRKWIVQMPSMVEENFRLRFEPKVEGAPEVPVVKFTDKDLTKLAEAANADRKAGVEVGSEGSQFMQGWNKLVAEGRVAQKEKKGLTRNEIIDKMSLVHDPLIKGVMSFCAGDDVNLLDIIEQMKTLRDSAARNTGGDQRAAS